MALGLQTYNGFIREVSISHCFGFRPTMAWIASSLALVIVLRVLVLQWLVMVSVSDLQ